MSREITPSDLEDARRGLSLARRSYADLAELKAAHEAYHAAQGLFASAVIVKAVEAEQGRRRAAVDHAVDFQQHRIGYD